ncbi:hypothetical protein J4401_07100 [Candidatus Woesearchaeota archaeon]|nr:hypothetical protein [Candidatus Woesearchaeota archaeon]
MTNITHFVWDFLNKHPAMQKSLKMGIVNVRALASYIIKQGKMDSSTHAVISAIRRYNAGNDSVLIGEKLAELFRDSKISTKSKLVSITVSRDFNFLAKIMPQVFSSIDVTRGELLRLAEGRESMKIIIDHRKKAEILSMMPKERVYEIKDNLGEVNVNLDDKKSDIPGVLSTLLTEIAANSINIVEILGGAPEIIIIVREKDLSRTHDLLLRFFYGDD